MLLVTSVMVLMITRIHFVVGGPCVPGTQPRHSSFWSVVIHATVVGMVLYLVINSVNMSVNLLDVNMHSHGVSTDFILHNHVVVLRTQMV